MFSKKIIICFVLFSYYCYAHERSCQQYTESFDSLFYNRVLIGQVIKSLFTRGGILSCAHRCLSLPSCSSYNYQMSESDHGVCELNGGKEGDQENLVERAGYVFALEFRCCGEIPFVDPKLTFDERISCITRLPSRWSNRTDNE